MARRAPRRHRRRPGGTRGAGAARPATAPATSVVAQQPADGGARAGLEARIAFALGALAFMAVPIAYQLTSRPASPPVGAEGFAQVLGLGGIIAAAAALLLGRRAWAAGDRSSSAVWASRLGGTAILGFAMVFFLLMSRPA